MQVVILAGGIGTRLRPLTYKIPKPMVVINNKPFLEYQLAYIKSFNLKKILLLVSYLGDQIEAYFGNGSNFGLNISYSYEKTPLGTGGALKNAEDKLEDNFFLLNGDTFLPINLNEVKENFLKNNKSGIITVYDNSEKIVKNNITIDHLNFVMDYNKEISSDKTHVDAGVLILKKEVLELISENKVCSLEKEIYNKLIEKKELVGFCTTQRFHDIGSFEELEIARKVLK
ncbi:MAG: nucleotidyltransferase family protein [Candidatus Firestonebacteria bacterium]|nr:nucleotidyltransferase family protein [Candidatus Firestonebacteria bacterium]